ncbi:MAG: aminopeptidase P family protein [Agathobaculum sp.]|uniref:aminopeptidase P family protein n=1 Tax=Agathobaculum sp. TaxID=2048138 RepID=UPI0025B9844A|nr:aminopeptidase P family protein [Agathobaculum sp.]MCI7125465.1 aminopeptidase P family protein [Agathobaculum sp.]MDY3712651.1 aminopeptidase P family protein [Agathobaculum sp.]
MRKQELAAMLQGAPYDALMLTSEVARRYATGFHSSAGAVYLSAKQAVFYTDFRYAEAARCAVTDFEVRELGSGASYAAAVNELIAQDGVKTVALEDKALTYAAYTAWADSLSATAVRLGDGLEKLRVCKSDEEVGQIVAAQRIAEQAFDEIRNAIKPGVSEKEIAARLTYLMLHYGAENLSFDPIVVSGANSSKPHGVPTDKPIEAGDFVTMDFGCIVGGYCSDMTRTVAVGHVTDEMQTVYDTVLHAQLAGIACCKAGVTGRAVDAAARRVIEQAGYGEAFGHGFGHGVGLEIHEAPAVSSRGQSPLPAGSIVTAEPGIYLPGRFGVRIEDMLYVIEDGCINLTEAPKQLMIL